MSTAIARTRRCFLLSLLTAALCPLLVDGTSAPAAAGPAASAEEQVNTHTVSAQSQSDIAVDADGDFVVTWASLFQDGSVNGVYAQHYDAAGIPQGAETRVNTATSGHQDDPSIAMDSDGDYVITWNSLGQDGSLGGVYAQRYDAAGTPQGAETRVNTTTSANQSDPSIAMDSDGDYVIAWSSVFQDGSGLGVYAQRYDAAGTPEGAETLVNTTFDSNQFEPAVAMDAEGDYVIAWTSDLLDGDGTGIFAQRYDAAGTPQGTETQVNTTTADIQLDPSVAMDADGDHVITWTSHEQDGSGSGVYAQRYNAAGTPQGTETQTNTTTTAGQQQPAVTMDALGNHVVTWTSHEQDGSSSGVYAQRYNTAGTPQGTETRVNVATFSDQIEPSIAMDADGDFVVTWSSYGQDGQDFGVFARRFRGPTPVDVGLTQSDNADPVTVDGRISYRVRVTNLNDDADATGFAAIDDAIGAASAVAVVSTMPDGATLLSTSGTGWTCGSPTATVRCRLAGTIAPGDVAPGLLLTFTAPDEAGPALHQARVYESQVDPVPANNVDTERTSVVCAFEFADDIFSNAENGSLSVGVNRSGTNCGPATVEYGTASGTALTGADFDDVSGTLVFDEGDTSESFEVPIVEDTLDETTEKLRLRLSSPEGALIGRPALVDASITDDDAPPRINFTTTSARGAEPGALVEATLRLSEVSGRPVTVTLNRKGTATPDADYFSPIKVTIPAGQRTTDFTIEVVDDAAAEGRETAALTLSAPVAVTLGSLKTFKLTITSDD